MAAASFGAPAVAATIQLFTPQGVVRDVRQVTARFSTAMSLYPYTCYEQRVSRAIALREEARWYGVMSDLPTYLDPDGLLRYFPIDWMLGSDTLTAYVLSIAQEAGYTIPGDSRARMLDAMKRFVEGRLVRDSVLPTADLTLRKLAAIEALSRYDAADAAMVSGLAIEPNLWPTSGVIAWINVLDRIEAIPHRSERRDEAVQVLRSRLNFQGTQMGFSTERSDALWWLMLWRVILRYEFTFGANSDIADGRYFWSPAMCAKNSVDGLPSLSLKMFFFVLRSITLWWMCIALPGSRAIGFDMNVAYIL